MNVPSEFDRLKQSLSGFVRSVMNRVDYLALYPGRVTVQNGDGTLQVQPDDARLPPAMDNLSVRYGVPGVTATVQAGTRVLVGFSNGRPDQPFAALWDPVGTTLTLNLQANTINLNNGTNGVARNGDACTWTGLTTSCPAGSGTVTPGVGSITINAGSSSVKCG